MTRPRQRLRPTVVVQDDAAIVGKIALGDLSALGTLYDRYAPHLLRFARRLVGSQDAADVVQTAFLRVATLSDTYDASFPSARPWLFGITVRVIHEHRRSLRRWAAAMLGLSQEPGRTPPSIPEARSDLHACLQRLSRSKRTVLVLVEVEGFTCKEVADMLAVPIGTVWTRLHHARRDLRRAYDGGDS